MSETIERWVHADEMAMPWEAHDPRTGTRGTSSGA